jgi:hypothetical protein
MEPDGANGPEGLGSLVAFSKLEKCETGIEAKLSVLIASDSDWLRSIIVVGRDLVFEKNREERIQRRRRIAND